MSFTICFWFGFVVGGVICISFCDQLLPVPFCCFVVVAMSLLFVLFVCLFRGAFVFDSMYLFE